MVGCCFELRTRMVNYPVERQNQPTRNSANYWQNRTAVSWFFYSYPLYYIRLWRIWTVCPISKVALCESCFCSLRQLWLLMSPQQADILHPNITVLNPTTPLNLGSKLPSQSACPQIIQNYSIVVPQEGGIENIKGSKSGTEDLFDLRQNCKTSFVIQLSDQTARGGAFSQVWSNFKSPPSGKLTDQDKEKKTTQNIQKYCHSNRQL